MLLSVFEINNNNILTAFSVTELTRNVMQDKWPFLDSFSTVFQAISVVVAAAGPEFISRLVRCHLNRMRLALVCAWHPGGRGLWVVQAAVERWRVKGP